MIDSYDSAIIPLGSDAVLRDRSEKLPWKHFQANKPKALQEKSLTNLYNICTCNFIFRYLNPQGGVRIGRLLEDMDVFAVHLVFKHVLNPRQVTAYALQSAL